MVAVALRVRAEGDLDSISLVLGSFSSALSPSGKGRWSFLSLGLGEVVEVLGSSWSRPLLLSEKRVGHGRFLDHRGRGYW